MLWQSWPCIKYLRWPCDVGLSENDLVTREDTHLDSCEPVPHLRRCILLCLLSGGNVVLRPSVSSCSQMWGESLAMISWMTSWQVWRRRTSTLTLCKWTSQHSPDGTVLCSYVWWHPPDGDVVTVICLPGWLPCHTNKNNNNKTVVSGFCRFSYTPPTEVKLKFSCVVSRLQT